MKTRKLLRLLQSSGAAFLRQKGSHKIFRLKDGTILVVPFSGAHLNLSPGLERQVRRMGLAG